MNAPRKVWATTLQHLQIHMVEYETLQDNKNAIPESLTSTLPISSQSTTKPKIQLYHAHKCSIEFKVY